MNEQTLKSAFVKEIRDTLKNCVIFRHEDKFYSGVPDISITLNKRTLWIEAKFANPKFQSKGIQELTMLRLAKAGLALYLVWQYDTDEKRTYLVHPSDIGKDMNRWSNFIEDFDHNWAVKELWKYLNMAGS